MRRWLLSAALLFLFTGCQINYLLKSTYHQMDLLSKRVPIEKALKDPSLTEKERTRLLLAEEVRAFANADLRLEVRKTFTSYVKLEKPYVTWVVSAASRWELKTHSWSYPFVGKLPYRGYFIEEQAIEEEEKMKKDFDTYMRGVSAYSTLGWFKDPILSSMMRYDESTYVNTLIHELVHATVFIKNNADFNERLAVFLGNKGMELFYFKKEGPDSNTVKQVKKENEDDYVFSKFISAEIAQLKKWYETIPEAERTEEAREKNFQAIKDRFKNDVWPKMKSDNWKKFSEVKLNNARLMTYSTYMSDLSDFEKLYEKEGRDFQKFIDKIRTLEKNPDPEKGLKELGL
ncbi:MAG: aminopeptidase [Bdellovibrionota bacterium]